MITPIVKITFTQVSTAKYPDRSKVFVLDFCTDFEVSSSWAQQVSTAKIKLPKNIFIDDGDGNLTSWQNQNMIVGDSPVFLRGDKIKIEAGYRYPDGSGGEATETNEIFIGFVSDVNPKIPVEIKCEDNMFLLKQKIVPNKTWQSPQYTIETMLAEMLQGTGLTIKTDNIQTTLGQVRTMGVTVAKVLDQLHSDYKTESYFRGNELRCGTLVYVPEDRNTNTFIFQENIVSDSLEYKRSDDVQIGIHAFSISKQELAELTYDGKKKTKKTRLDAFVGDEGGDVRTMYFISDTVDDLKKQATARLNKLTYEGFHGSFTGFGLPFVKHGDSVILQDSILPERNGEYLVKSVVTSGGVSGFRQKIECDIRIDILTQNEIDAGL